SSDRPALYTSAVSTKLIPASSARWTIRTHSSSSVLPHSPNIIAPRHCALTLTPVRPSVLYSIEQTSRHATTPSSCPTRCRRAPAPFVLSLKREHSLLRAAGRADEVGGPLRLHHHLQLGVRRD